ncbi:pilin family protein [Methylomagnum ishizawai]|nr:pilin family protein [Methylomagnum ishizawai]
MFGNGLNRPGLGASHSGYTLVEMLVVVSMLGILASIALPAYRDYVVRGKLPEATANLAQKRVNIEQYFQDNRTYVSAPDCDPDTTTSKYFIFVCNAVAATTFTLQAVGTGDMTGFTFSIDTSGTKRTVAVPTGWTLPTTNCWVTRKDGSC